MSAPIQVEDEESPHEVVGEVKKVEEHLETLEKLGAFKSSGFALRSFCFVDIAFRWV
jgi:hypothetical protein